jgi:hypothetical protein
MNQHAKKAADILHAADKRSSVLDDALQGIDHNRVKEAYTAFFTEWKGDFDAAIAENQRTATSFGVVRLTLFSAL